MRNVLICLFFMMLVPVTALAACQGRDLGDTLTAEERDDLAKSIADMPFPEGNRWRATRGSRELLLVGTMHFDDPRFDAVMARLQADISAADAVIVEAGPEQQQRLAKAMLSEPDRIFLTSGPTLVERLPAEDWAALRSAVEARGLPGFFAAKMQPWYVSMLLALPPCLVEAAGTPPRGLDQRVIEAAEREGIPLRAIEPWDTLFEVLGSDPIEDQIEMLRLSLLAPEQGEDAMATLRSDYFEERHGVAIETSRVLAKRWLAVPGEEVDRLFDAMMQDLMVRRNHAWIRTLESMNGHRLVVAVGAGHLAGTHGLLQLLQDRGWHLSREPF